jgi:PhnB protein
VSKARPTTARGSHRRRRPPSAPRVRRSFAPPGWPRIVPRIVVRDPRALVEFIRKVFDAAGRYSDDGPSELRVGGAVVMVSQTLPGVRGVYTAFLYVYVPDVDATYRRAIRRGARSVEPPVDLPYGDRRCMFKDHWGNTWQAATRIR